MKQGVLNLMVAAGAFDPFRLANRAKTAIITYHRFSEGETASRTSARTFARQLDYLCAHYTIVPLSLIAAHLAGAARLPPSAAAITIDDGYRDTYEIAFPILQRYRVPATFFLVTDFIDRKTWLWTDRVRFLLLNTSVREVGAPVAGDQIRLELGDRHSRLAAATRVNAALKGLPDIAKDEAIKRLASMLALPLPEQPPAEFAPVTWEQVCEMSAGGIEIGSHTMSHPILTQVGHERLRRELEESKVRIEAVVGKRVDWFCYPNGDFDANVLRATESADYRCAVSTRPGLNDRNAHPLALRRIDAERDLAHFVQSISGFEQLKNKLRRGVAAVSGEGAFACLRMV